MEMNYVLSVSQRKTLNYKKPKRKRITVGLIFIYIFFAIFCFLCLFPFWYVLVGAFSNGQDYLNGGVWIWPRKWDLSNFQYVLQDKALWSGLLVTVSRLLIGVTCALLFTSMAAYAMSRKNLRGKKVFRIINLCAMYFGGGLIPFFVWMVQLGLYNNFLVYILPGLYSVYNMLVFSTFFRGIPEELHEAAIIDGANEFQIMFKIYFRMSGPAFATIGMWLGLAHWNAYYDCMLYCSTNDNLHTLQYYLLHIVQSASSNNDGSGIGQIYSNVTARTVSYAAIVLSCIPVIAAFPFITRTIKHGVSLGAVKE